MAGAKITGAATRLDRPNDASKGRAPIALLGSEQGMHTVEALLGRIAHGLAA